MPLFQRIGIDEKVRQIIYKNICIPIRLTLAYLVYAGYIPLLVTTVLSAITAFHLTIITTIKEEAGVWWSRKIHATNAICIVLVYMSNHSRRTGIISTLLVADVILGIVYNFRRNNKKP